MATTLTQIILYRGEFLQVLVTVADEATGAPVDLTGATVSLSAWATLGATETIITLGSPGAGIDIAPDQTADKGQATLTFDPAMSATIELNEHAVFVLWVTDASGHPRVAIPPSPFRIREAKTATPPAPP